MQGRIQPISLPRTSTSRHHGSEHGDCLFLPQCHLREWLHEKCRLVPESGGPPDHRAKDTCAMEAVIGEEAWNAGEHASLAVVFLPRVCHTT